MPIPALPPPLLLVGTTRFRHILSGRLPPALYRGEAGGWAAGSYAGFGPLALGRDQEGGTTGTLFIVPGPFQDT